MKEFKRNRLQVLSEKVKLYNLLKNQNNKHKYGLDMDYEMKQIDYGIKSITYYEYTDEEKSFKEIISLKEKKNLTEDEKSKLDDLLMDKRKKYSEKELNDKINYLTACFKKHTSGQYHTREQLVEYTNYNKNIEGKLDKLKLHEMIHAITQKIYINNKKIDMESFVKNLPVKLRDKDFNLQDYTIVSGYSTVKINNNLECVDIKNETFMEMCTESLAGILSEEENTKEFKEFNIPSKMSAYYWTNAPRDLLITAIGSSDFLIDMLKEDSIQRFDRLNERIKKEYNSNIIENFDEFLKRTGSLDEEERDKAYYEMENELYNIFIERLSKEDNSLDINEQIEFFKDTLTTKEFKKLDFEKEIQNKKDNFRNNLINMKESEDEVLSKYNSREELKKENVITNNINERKVNY